MFQVTTLSKIATSLAVSGVGLGAVYMWKVEKDYKNWAPCREALSNLRNNPGAKYLMGEPIIASKMKKQNLTDNTVELVRHVEGPKDKGKMYFWIYVSDDEKDIKLNRIELALEKEKGRRLLVMS